MTYRELYEKATRQLEHNEITLGEYEEMTKPLDQKIRNVGIWIKKKSFGDWKDYLKCSCCGDSTYDAEKEDCTEFLNYCPTCGAEMRGCENG